MHRKTKKKSAEETRNEIVDAGLDLPGIPEMLRVYDGWRLAESGLESYRNLLKLYRPICIATNNANKWIDDAPVGTDS